MIADVPIETERSCGIASVATITPLSSSLRRTSIQVPDVTHYYHRRSAAFNAADLLK